MSSKLSPGHLRRLDIQGFDAVAEDRLAEVAPWLRLAFALCAALAVIGVALASVPMLLVLAVIAGLGAASPVHPFDPIYNHGIRRFTGTGPLPRRGAPSRFACGLGAVWLLATAWAFSASIPVLGYVLGVALCGVAALVATVDVCIPSMTYRLIFGPPAPREPAPVEGEGRPAPRPRIDSPQR